MQFDNGPMQAQSGAMLRYIGATFSTTLYPISKIMAIEEAIGVVGDLQRVWTPAMYMAQGAHMFEHNEGFGKTEQGQVVVKKMRETFAKEHLPKFLTFFERLLNKNNGKWLASTDEPTIADCVAVPALRGFTRGHIDHVPTTCLETHPKVIDYIKRFCSLEPIKGRYTNGIF